MLAGYITGTTTDLGRAREHKGDVYLYDRKTGRLLPTPGLNSRAEDFDPCVVALGGKE